MYSQLMVAAHKVESENEEACDKVWVGQQWLPNLLVEPLSWETKESGWWLPWQK